MLFNSLEFVIFFTIFFAVYWGLSQKVKLQNLFIFASSLVFYGWWDWRFVFLLIGSATIDYFAGLAIEGAKTQSKRKLFLWMSMLTNIGILFFFKYYSFFVNSFVEAFLSIGVELHPTTWHIILPVGISFYTFQAMSYTIDIYRRQLEPTRDFVQYMTFIAFFPPLVAGPIERAKHLLNQFSYVKKFDYQLAVDGLRQILWGFFKKMVIADSCAPLVNEIFTNYSTQSTPTLIMGAVLFAFQIYGDFSGYSDIAIGTSKLLGIRIIKNFNLPYFSRDIAEFWRRWHISLNTWFRDYIYIPLGGSKDGKWMAVRNTFIIFLISGFWHGANWTFLFWGFFHALLFIPLLVRGKNRRNLDTVAQNSFFPSIREILQMGWTFLLVCIGWIFFRADNITEAFGYIEQLFSFESLSVVKKYFAPIPFIILMLIFEWFGRKLDHPLQLKFPLVIRWAVYYLFLILLWYAISAIQKSDFIYFAF